MALTTEAAFAARLVGAAVRHLKPEFGLRQDGQILTGTTAEERGKRHDFFKNPSPRIIPARFFIKLVFNRCLA